MITHGVECVRGLPAYRSRTHIPRDSCGHVIITEIYPVFGPVFSNRLRPVFFKSKVNHAFSYEVPTGILGTRQHCHAKPHHGEFQSFHVVHIFVHFFTYFYGQKWSKMSKSQKIHFFWEIFFSTKKLDLDKN